VLKSVCAIYIYNQWGTLKGARQPFTKAQNHTSKSWKELLLLWSRSPFIKKGMDWEHNKIKGDTVTANMKLVLLLLIYHLVMGPDQNFLTWVRSGQPFLVWVWVWKISPKNPKLFNFFSFGSKKSHRVRSKSLGLSLENFP